MKNQKFPTREVYKRAVNALLLSFMPLVLISCSMNPPEVKTDVSKSPILMAKYSRPLKDLTYEASPERLSRGKYLTEGLYCMTCHTERDETQAGWPPLMEKKFSGGLRYKTDSTWLYAPNLTPDKETGIGNFTDDMIARAIREGVGHDGRSLVTAGRGGMPWQSFRNLSDEDLASIICFLRSIPAVKNEIPKRNIGAKNEEVIASRAYPLLTVVPEPDYNDPLSVGTYLVNVGDCMGCHTNWGRNNLGVYGGGLKFSEPDQETLFSLNISSDKSGMGGWSKEAFIFVLKSGKGGVLSEKMPWITFKNLSEEDLGAIYEALMTSYPIDHKIMNRAPLSYCKACDREHGLGDQNQKEALVSFNADYKIPEDLAGTYYNTMFDKDTVTILHEEGKLVMKNWRNWEFIPVSETTYRAAGYLAPMVFARNEDGSLAGFKFQTLEPNAYKKIDLQ